jgi:hypothetical protein
VGEVGGGGGRAIDLLGGVAHVAQAIRDAVRLVGHRLEELSEHEHLMRDAIRGHQR